MIKQFGRKIANIFNRKAYDEEFFEELEDTLIEGDLGTKITFELSEHIRDAAKRSKLDKEGMQKEMKQILSQYVTSADMKLPSSTSPHLFLVLGVNGVGKTTSIAKIARFYQNLGIMPLLSAADTFRAGAIEQLSLHAERLQSRIIKQKTGSDPGAVIYDSIDSAASHGEQLILADTAGRMHTKENLLKELKKVDKIIRNKIPMENYKKLLVVDATTGQNGVRQAELFHEAVPLDAIILTKYDSASKGGGIIQIGKQFGVPIAFVGVGERYEDIKLFDSDDFLNTLLGIE